MTSPRVLLVDDEPYVLDALGQLLESEGYEVARAATFADARSELASSQELDVVLTDFKLPDGDALGVLEIARDARPNVPVLVFSGVGTLRHAIDAMKAGALDFLAKPVDSGALLAIVKRALEHRGLVEEVRRLRAAVGSDAAQPRIVGESRVLKDLLTLARRAAATEVRVLLRGESGTGKELLALEIHRASKRASKPFVRVNCAAIADTLFESEMFGHKKGAFTGATDDRSGHFAEAHGGTLALDEVATLSEDAQAKLLRVLETGEYTPVGESRVRRADVRVLAITNEDLAARVKAGKFREDLFFRLNVVPIVVPPLRERKDDLPALTEYLLRQIARRDTGPRKKLDAGALSVLTRHDWPGNVRELRNVLEHASILSEGEWIRGETLAAILEGGISSVRPDRAAAPPAPAEPVKTGAGDAISVAVDDDLTLRRRTEDFQRELIQMALTRSAGRRGECARLLGIDPRNLAYYLRKHGFIQDSEA